MHGAESIFWDLSDLYKSVNDPAWKRDAETVKEEAEQFAGRWRGRLDSLESSEFSTMMQEYEQLVERSRKVGAFAHLAWSVSTDNPELGKALQAANELGAEIGQTLAFFQVEWMAVDDSRAGKLIASDDLEPYRHYLEASRRFRDHTLSEGEEKVLSAKRVTGRTAWTRYFDEVMGKTRYELDGESLSQQQVLSKLHHPDRHLRKRAHASITDTLHSLRHTTATIFNTVLADKATDDRLRGYPHWCASRNLANEIDHDSVDRLVESVTSAYPVVQNYYELKREWMGLDQLYDYDRYTSIRKTETVISWDEARETVLEAFNDFHPEMARIAKLFFDRQWIDAAIKPGKRGGAYSASTVASVHPYVFMNYDGQLRDVQTLAHELGHGVHQYLSRQQGELQSSTPLTTAETASVFAEMLVFEKMMTKLEDPEERLSLLVSKIDDTIATVFRQVSMNRFEHAIHTARREDGEQTFEQFSAHWRSTQTDLYGNAVHLTDGYDAWWSYVPHFLHTPGYVYAYAFGELLVLALYQSWKEGASGFEDRYLELLSAGGSDWPHSLISRMGMDIHDASFWSRGLSVFESMVEDAKENKARIKSP
ncbi:MAG: M3 family oligoendopeptidase [Balneolaceae bacterium]